MIGTDSRNKVYGIFNCETWKLPPGTMVNVSFLSGRKRFHLLLMLQCQSLLNYLLGPLYLAVHYVPQELHLQINQLLHL